MRVVQGQSPCDVCVRCGHAGTAAADADSVVTASCLHLRLSSFQENVTKTGPSYAPFCSYQFSNETKYLALSYVVSAVLVDNCPDN